MDIRLHTGIDEFDELFEHSWLDHLPFIQTGSHLIKVNHTSDILSQFFHESDVNVGLDQGHNHLLEHLIQHLQPHNDNMPWQNT